MGAMRVLPALLLVASCDRVFGLTEGSTTPADSSDGDSTLGLGLVASYPMESVGTTLTGCMNDLVGSHDGNCDSPITLGSGCRGSGFVFDGTTNVVRIPTDEMLNLTTFTVVYELFITAAITQAACPVDRPFGSADDNSWSLCFNSGPMMIVAGTNGTGNQSATTSILPSPGAWHQVAITWDGTNLTGKLDGNPTVLTTATMPYDAAPIVVGADLSPSPNRHFAGQLDELQIYSRVVSDPELAVLARCK